MSRAVIVARACAWGAIFAATGWLGRAEPPRTNAPAGVMVQTGIVYRSTPVGRLRLDVYRPAHGGSASPAVLAIHGGGWAGGAKSDFAGIANRLAEYGYVVVAANYTLSRPGRPSWPAAVDDLRAALRWLREHAADRGVDPRRVVAFGTSAGGHLAALLATTSSDDDILKVQAVVDFYGPSDLRPLTAQNPEMGRSIAQFLGTDPGAYDHASPARQVTAAAPPMLLVHGADDSRVPPAQSERLAAALGAAGVPCRLLVIPGARHGFGLRVGEQRDLLPEILSFLDDVWNARTAPQKPGVE